jgi:hypothetical protein
MTVTTPFLGHQALLGTVAEVTYGTTPSPGTLAALTNAFVFESESIKKHGNIIQRNGLRGTRSHVGDDSRVGHYGVGGPLSLEPTPVDLLWWLPYILGAAPVSTTYSLAETLPSFSLGVTRNSKNYLYKGCVISRAVISGSRGGMLKLALDIVGQSETLSAVGSPAWPSITADVTGPYIFEGDTVLTINSVARQITDFELTIDNHIDAERFFNSLTIVSAPSNDRTIALKCSVPYLTAQADDLYDQGIPGYTGATLAFTSGGHSASFAFGELQAPADSPTAATRGENFLTLNYMVLQTSTTKELVVTAD